MERNNKKSRRASSAGSIARIIDLIASEYGWTVEEILDKRTFIELTALAKAVERRTREKRSIRALDCGADKIAVRKELTRIEQEYERGILGAETIHDVDDQTVLTAAVVNRFFGLF